MANNKKFRMRQRVSGAYDTLWPESTTDQILIDQDKTINLKKELIDRVINVRWYGAKGDGVTDDTAAIVAAIAYVVANGGILYFPQGTYIVSAGINLSGINNLSIMGAGVDKTIIKTNSTSADVFYTTAGTTNRWLTIKDMTISSSVNKTSGSHLGFKGTMTRTVIENLKLVNWFQGIAFESFEVCWINLVNITNPSPNADSAIQVGKINTAAMGANLCINNSFLRGSDGIDGVGGSNTYANYGVKILDADAVFMENTDIGEFLLNDLLISPSTRSNNHHFTQCFFDATKNGDCVKFDGAGLKGYIQFTGCWFASAGQSTGGASTPNGINIANAGTYTGMQITGGRVYNCKGNGIKCNGINDVHIIGLLILSNGQGMSAGNNHGILIDTPLNQPAPKINGCFLGGNTGADIYTTDNSRLYSISNTECTGIVTDLGEPKNINNLITGNPSTVASALSITIPSDKNFITITGTQNIGGIAYTYTGHVITLAFQSALVVIDNSANIRLSSNFTSAVYATLTLICSGTEWYEVARSLN